jgi:hypothetical protein
MDGAESDVSGLALPMVVGLTLYWWAVGIPKPGE